jgi:hypothetical protein
MVQSSILLSFMAVLAMSMCFMAIYFLEASVIASISACIFIIEASSHFIASWAEAGADKANAKTAAAQR